MKILLVSQYYWPENFRITEIAETLVSLGHEVTVLTGLPNYPEGYIYDGYKNKKNWNQIHNGVNIIRAREIGRRNNVLFRVLNYYSFPFFANRKLRKLGNNFDVVLINELSPIMGAKPGIKFKKLFKTKVLMYEMDLWPESLLAGGITNNSFIYKHYKKVSSKIYSKCDKILVSTSEHIDYIKALPHCNESDIEFLPQYADKIFENSNFGCVDNETIDLLFAGNIGMAQSINTILDAATILKDNNKYLFHIVGNGTELANLKKIAEERKLSNVIFYGNKPLEEMVHYYSLADAMLLTLENKSYANMTIPGKVQSYMASGKPIIASINGSSAEFIKENEIGYVVPAEDEEALAKLILSLEMDELRKIGNTAKKKYFEKYNKDKFFAKLVEELEKLSKNK